MDFDIQPGKTFSPVSVWEIDGSAGELLQKSYEVFERENADLDAESFYDDVENLFLSDDEKVLSNQVHLSVWIFFIYD